MSAQNMHYLTVNDEDFYYKASSSKLSPNRHKHKERSASPMAMSYESSSMASMASTPDLSSVSEMSLDQADQSSSTDSSPSLSKKRPRSIENLCFGMRNRKKLHRKIKVNEIQRGRCYTDSDLKNNKKPIKYQVPILKFPTDDEGANNGNNDDYEGRDDYEANSDVPSSGGGGSGRRGIGSLLKQTLKVTSASMGFRTLSVERVFGGVPNRLSV
ncbi:uncharacterized protein LOC109613365 [Musca domestica]|uniref:Uncharacterized protein LOC109613365 n=1 Tax=Musca domestica TaxID=7370 RepID=A0ABM3UY76_MUSDO|nr:uncharacterized protein LOC109613365 [Musca domestica]